MSKEDGSDGPLCPTRAAAEDHRIALKLLRTSVALMRCRDLIADERAHEARIQMTRAHGILDELEDQALDPEQTRDVVALLRLAVKLEAKLRLFAMGYLRTG